MESSPSPFSVTTRTIDGRVWHTDATLPPEIADLCAADLDAVHLRPDVTCFRNKRTRRTMLVPCGDHLALVKEMRAPTGRARIGSWVRGRSAAREWYWACRFANAGVPMPRPLAYHDGGYRDTSWFIQEGLPNAAELLKCYWHAFGSRAKDRDAVAWMHFADQLGALLAAVHCAGANHPDLHPGNILCIGTTPGTLQLYLVDYHSIRPGGGQHTRSAEANLAKLLLMLTPLMVRKDIVDIVGAYQRHLPDTPRESADSFVRRIEHRLPAMRRRRARSRGRRVFVRSGGFDHLRLGNRRIWYRREHALEDVLGLLDALHAGDLTMHKVRSGSAVYHGTLPSGKTAWIKTYDHRGVVKQVEARLGLAHGRRGWYAAERLYHLEIRAPHSVAYVEEWVRGRLVRSQLITTHVGHRTDLDQLLFTGSRTTDDPAALRSKRGLIAILGRHIRWMHDMGVFHRDLSAKNILVSSRLVETQLADERHVRQVVGIVDLDSVRFPLIGMWRYHRHTNLAQLTGLPSTITARDRLRFYTAYCGDSESARAAMAECAAILRRGAKTQAAWREREAQAQHLGHAGPHQPADPHPLAYLADPRKVAP